MSRNIIVSEILEETSTLLINRGFRESAHILLERAASLVLASLLEYYGIDPGKYKDDCIIGRYMEIFRIENNTYPFDEETCNFLKHMHNNKIATKEDIIQLYFIIRSINVILLRYENNT